MNYAILTVIYNETATHYSVTSNALSYMLLPGIETYAVVNKRYEKGKYPEKITYIENDENCLAKAWNLGLREIFKNHDFAVVTGNDSILPTKTQLDSMIECLGKNPLYGIVSAIPKGMVGGDKPIKHGDGSFSLFAISKKTFEDVGGFDEDFKPAYFEDNDYLERLWQKGYTPRQLDIVYYHIFQATMKYGDEIKRSYGEYMNKNLELFRKKYGKTPDHLPSDIHFS